MKNWKAIFGVTAVFVLGMAAGSLVTIRVAERRLSHAGPQAVEHLIVRRLSLRLRLDAAQREQLRAIVHNGQQDMQTARQQIQPQVEQVLDHAVNRVRDILRPEQREKFDKIVAEQRPKWKPSGP